MPVVDSRLGPGTLVLGTLTSIECQMANVRLEPSADETDGTPTLCEPAPAPELTTSWVLAGTAIQDFEDDAGFVEYCRLNDGTTVTFTWIPATAYGVEFSGSVQVRAVAIGGDVAVQITTDWEFPVVGDITRTDPETGARTTIAA